MENKVRWGALLTGCMIVLAIISPFGTWVDVVQNLVLLVPVLFLAICFVEDEDAVRLMVLYIRLMNPIRRLLGLKPWREEDARDLE